MKKHEFKEKGNILALSPLLVFALVFILISVISKDFYAVPVTVPFLIAAIFAVFMNRRVSINEKINIFCKGAGESNIILMILIFILSGAFAEIAKAMGAVESTVNLGLTLLPGNILVTGIFIIACFIAISIGTSMGTIVALVPIATGIAGKTSIPIALIVGAVVGGAMFGDNLSMISDTTIAATRTQGCEMKDKFRMNFFIVLPAAIITAILFAVIATGNGNITSSVYSYNLVKILPYIAVLGTALAGMNVILILVGGIVFAGGIGILTGAVNLIEVFQSIAKGIGGMSELVVISLIIGGMVELIKYNGGIDFLLNFITKRIKSKKGAELGIAALVSLVDICTANNTIAIVTAGPIAKDIAEKYDIEPKRSAGILDMFSCVFQGIIPYGAQLLSAATLAGISPFQIMKYLYYPYLMGISALIAILFVEGCKSDRKNV
jgi:Na+/H+ antiporter NhaC